MLNIKKEPDLYSRATNYADTIISNRKAYVWKIAYYSFIDGSLACSNCQNRRIKARIKRILKKLRSN